MYIDDILNYDFRKPLAEEIYDRSVRGPYGLADQSDYDRLVGEGIINDSEYWTLVGAFKDGILNYDEFEKLSSSPRLKVIAGELKELMGPEGTNALCDRVKWLKDNAGGIQPFMGYSEKNKREMSLDLTYLERKLDALNYLNPSAGAILAQAGLTTKNGTPKLLGYLEDRDPNMRLTAAHLLGEVLPKETDKVIPTLRKLFEDEDPDVQTAAAIAVLNIAATTIR